MYSKVQLGAMYDIRVIMKIGKKDDISKLHDMDKVYNWAIENK